MKVGTVIVSDRLKIFPQRLRESSIAELQRMATAKGESVSTIARAMVEEGIKRALQEQQTS